MKPLLRAQKTQLLLCMLGLALACGRANAAPAAPPTADTLLQAPAAPPVDGDDIRNAGKVTGAALEAVQKARGFIAKLKEAGRFLERITGGDLIALPAGVQKQIGNVVYTMGVSAVRLKPTHTEVDIFLEIDLPEQEEDLVFGAEGIAFSREGGFVGHVELALLGGYGVFILAIDFCMSLPRKALNSRNTLRGVATLRSSLFARPKGLPSYRRALLRIARPSKLYLKFTSYFVSPL